MANEATLFLHVGKFLQEGEFHNKYEPKEILGKYVILQVALDFIVPRIIYVQLST